MEPVLLHPIGQVVSERKNPQNDDWDRVPCSIQLDRRRFSEESLAGLGDFSHVVVVYYMHQVDPDTIENNARHPRNNPAWPKVGIFAQRGKNRPNQIGVTVCELIRRRQIRRFSVETADFYV
jgi:tRNA (Thr-GGU) A37 N-methylase